MSAKKPNEDELMDAYATINRLQTEAKERNKTETLIVAGAAGLAVYLLLGMGAIAGFLGLCVFVGIAIWKKAFF